MRHMRAVGVLVFATVVALLLAGCGSVGDVGYGASRAGVEPVRGTYGSGTSPYAASMSTQQQTQRVETLAKANEKTEKKTATVLNKIKAEPDASGPDVADVEVPTQPTLDPQMKALIARQETALPAAADRIAADDLDR
ncbi:MAG: hypothetical protein FJX75_02600 [Armatimonadetes bacterium]|nr:hypothetical protein [Armatimonadota bacterium]